MNTVTEENDESQQQTYQNLAQLNEQAVATTSNDDIYANQNQLFTTQTEGIYDNDCIITAQMKNAITPVKNAQPYEPNVSETTSIDQCAAMRNYTSVQAPNKPPIANKPSALQAKIKALNNAGLSVTTVDKYIPPLAATTQPLTNEPLKIVENEPELYCNAKVLLQK